MKQRRMDGVISKGKSAQNRIGSDQKAKAELMKKQGYWLIFCSLKFISKEYCSILCLIETVQGDIEASCQDSS